MRERKVSIDPAALYITEYNFDHAFKRSFKLGHYEFRGSRAARVLGQLPQTTRAHDMKQPQPTQA